MKLHSKGVIYFMVAIVASFSADRAFAGDSVKVCVQVIQKDVRPKPEEAQQEDKKPNKEESAEGAKEAEPRAVNETPNQEKETSAGNKADGVGTPPETESREGESVVVGPPVQPGMPVAGTPAGFSPQNVPASSGGASGLGTASTSATPDEETWDKVIRDRRKSLVYIKRLLEYYVTHEPGYEAVGEGCQETIYVELYPITEGWTAFARFSKNDREERVDTLTPDELSQFSERAVLALLHDVSISETIARDTVLRSDSKKTKQKIRGNNHFTMAVGTQIRGGYLDTAITDLDNSDVGDVEKRIRIIAPMQTAMGYRGRFETWGIESRMNLTIGTEKISASKNPPGGHADFAVGTGLSLHVFRYAKPRGLTSFYYGAGGTFELIWFSAINAQNEPGESRSRLLSGGLDVDGALGVEFMRASSVQFFIQGDLNLPAYVVSRENSYTRIRTWFPGLTIQLGIMF